MTKHDPSQLIVVICYSLYILLRPCLLPTLTTELTEPTLPAGDCCGDIGDGVPVVRLQLALFA